MKGRNYIVVSVTAAAVALALSFWIPLLFPTQHEQTQRNYLTSTLADLHSPTSDNERVRRYECIDSTYKADQYLAAGANKADVAEYLHLCAVYLLQK